MNKKHFKKTSFGLITFIFIGIAVILTKNSYNNIKELYRSDKLNNTFLSRFKQTLFGLLFITMLSNNDIYAQFITPINSIGNISDNGSIYWGGTLFCSAINGTTTYFNIKKLHKYDKYRSNAIFGVLAGGAQTAFGFAFLKSRSNYQELATVINIGTGLTTVVTSIIRLATKNPPKESSLSFNIMLIPPSSNKESVMAFQFTKQLK